MTSTVELGEMKAALEKALSVAVTETIKAKPSNPVLYLAHRLIQAAQLPPVEPPKQMPIEPEPKPALAAPGDRPKPKRRTSKAWAPRQQLAQDCSTNLEHNSKLDIYSMPSIIRNSSIICTIGPKVESVEKLTMLRESGMNIMRLNFSHGSHEEHAVRIANVRESITKNPLDGQLCAIALDTKGPEIRTGINKAEDTLMTAGETVTVTTDASKREMQDKDLLYMDYVNLPKVIEVGQKIFVDDGLLQLEVKAKDVAKGELTCLIVNTATIGSRKGCNLPNVDVDLPALSEKDKSDLRFGVQQGVDMVFASFIRKASDVQDVRACLVAADAVVGKQIRIISKIENHEGVRNFDGILAETDGVMVARGDLGIEIPAEKVFLAQKSMIAKCNLVGKPVICATQMLESMTGNPRPTRAEVSDVANAILDGADCVMLSGETAKGKYPQEAVKMMHAVCVEAESALFARQVMGDLTFAIKPPLDPSEAVAKAAVEAASQREAVLIFTLTSSGSAARLISKYRPRCPIIAITNNASAGASCNLNRGVMPYLCPLPREDADGEANAGWIEQWLQWAIAKKKAENMICEGDTVVLAHGWKTGQQSLTTYRIITIE